MGNQASPKWDREIPEEQRKVDEDIDSGELTPYEKAQDLSQEFAHIDRRTTGTGTVLCDVEGIYKASQGGSIAVKVSLPGPDEATKTFNFASPKVWSEMYDFVRWVEHYGFSSSNFEAMIQEDVEVKVTQDSRDGQYDLFIPERDTPVRERTQSAVSTLKRTILSAFRNGPSAVVYVGGFAIITYILYSVTIGGILGWQEVAYSVEAYTGEGTGTPKSIAVYGIPAIAGFIHLIFNIGLIALTE